MRIWKGYSVYDLNEGFVGIYVVDSMLEDSGDKADDSGVMVSDHSYNGTYYADKKLKPRSSGFCSPLGFFFAFEFGLALGILLMYFKNSGAF